ncbi:hypothetical protein IC582_001227 [Cucumis melo]|uniref:NAC domain-containing protein 17-like n=1 Tax=Cucumis melo TaxID=3656 RepID=A0A1S3BI46_CUCME|nr:NAC domain-containing protein 17-like [Cucumis melo]
MKLLRLTSADDDNPWPPGFRFHPTDDELILYYLKRKICGRKIKLDVVADIDVYKWDPEELPGLSKLKTGDRQWFFFCPRDRKYPNGAKSNRATSQGYWKVTGKDRTVKCNSRNVGVKKTLVFYRGRAPKGERTDWVMHEYTMNEEELTRCTNVQSYYAVYKVFKKSGPGPKNGEQYGAPFKEEDWVDEEFRDFNFSDDQEIPAEKPKMDATDIEGETCQATHFSLDDFDRWMKQISDEDLFQSLEADPCANSLPLGGGQKDYASTIDLHSQEYILPRSVEVPNSKQQPSISPESNSNSDVSQLHPFQNHDAKSPPNVSELASFLFEGDYLEMDDLVGPEFNLSNTQKPSGSGNLQLEEINGLNELDQFHDAVMFLDDFGPLEYGPSPNLYKNENSSNVTNPMDGQFQSNPAITGQIGNQMLPDSAMNGLTLSEMQRTSGVLCDSSNFVGEANENEVGEHNSASRVSSALWAFVESIPTTPASAAEVNQSFDFDRIPSFSRRRLNMNSTTVSSINSSSLMTRRSGRSKKGRFFLFSIVGALFAILWVFMGAVRMWQRCISL